MKLGPAIVFLLLLAVSSICNTASAESLWDARQGLKALARLLSAVGLQAVRRRLALVNRQRTIRGTD
jgi:hypothetical protein